ncbi:T9SS type A sorting domain-containing protein [bacterium]|nr:T9SS type A sorting domain-containing protein [bacterium]
MKLILSVAFLLVLFSGELFAISVSPELGYVDYGRVFFFSLWDLACQFDTVDVHWFRDTNNDGWLTPSIPPFDDWGVAGYPIAIVVDGDMSFDTLSIPYRLPDFNPMPGVISTVFPGFLTIGLNFLRFNDRGDGDVDFMTFIINGAEPYEKSISADPPVVLFQDRVTITDTIQVWSRDNRLSLSSAEFWLDNTPNLTPDGDPGEGNAIPMSIEYLGSRRYVVRGEFDPRGFSSGAYEVWVRGRDSDGNWTPFLNFTEGTVYIAPSGVDETGPEGRDVVCYPNPFNSSVYIDIGPLDGEICEVSIFDIGGKKVSTVASGRLTSELLWSPTGDIPGGMYFVVISAVNCNVIRKVIYLK